MRYLLGLLFVLISFGLQAQQLACTSCDVVLDDTYGHNGNNYTYSPGDTICFDANIARGSIRLENWHGTEANPLTFINCDGKALISGTTNIGFKIVDMTYFRLTGTGDNAIEYGIHLDNIGATAIEIRGGKSHNYEIDHIEVSNAGLGWHVTNPFNCTTPDGWERNFIMRNVSFHHNNTHDITGEGYYIGYSNDKSLDCDGDGVDETFPMKIRNIRFYNNISENTEWDGMQIGNADSAVYVYNNVMTNFGTDGTLIQDDGMVVNNNCVGEWYNNLIINNAATNGLGGGISVLGYNVNIYNNVIIDGNDFGIFIGDRSKTTDDYFKVWNNTIINTGDLAIDWNDQSTTNSELKNNILVDPEGEYLEDSNNGIDQATNETNTDTTNLDFVDPTTNNFRLKSSSIAVDAGTDLNYFDYDKDSLDRNSVTPWDIGAYELGATAFSGGGGDPTNSPPNLSSIPDFVLSVGDVLNEPISATDANDDPITLTGINLPAFISVTDDKDGTGTLNITPNDGDAGDYFDMEVQAEDSNGATDSEFFDVQVNDTTGVPDIFIPEEYLR